MVDPSTCGGLLEIVTLIRKIVRIVTIIIPIALIGFGLIDLGKAVIASKEDEMKKAQGALIKRVIYCIVIFLIPTIVSFATDLVGAEDWKDCWNAAGGSTTIGEGGGVEG